MAAHLYPGARFGFKGVAGPPAGWTRLAQRFMIAASEHPGSERWRSAWRGGDIHDPPRHRRGGAARADRGKARAGGMSSTASSPCCAGQGEGLHPRGLPGARPHHLLPALVHGGPGGDRQLLRARDAGAGDAGRCSTRPLRLGIGFYLGYAERTTSRGGAPLQHLHSRRSRRAGSRQVSQGASPGPRRARRQAALPASREALFRDRRSRLPGLARRSAASSACASATTGAGPKPTGSWGSRASRW